jgi:hypothetical protein
LKPSKLPTEVSAHVWGCARIPMRAANPLELL